MRSRLIVLAASAALFCSPALAAPVWAPSQGGSVGANVACTNVNGDAIRCIQPSVTLNDPTGASIGTASTPMRVLQYDPSTTWTYAFALKGIGTPTVKAAAGAGVRNYVTAIQLDGVAATVVTRITIRDGSTDLAYLEVPAGASTRSVTFPTPLRGSANTAVVVDISAAGPVTINLQGFTATY